MKKIIIAVSVLVFGAATAFAQKGVAVAQYDELQATQTGNATVVKEMVDEVAVGAKGRVAVVEEEFENTYPNAAVSNAPKAMAGKATKAKRMMPAAGAHQPVARHPAKGVVLHSKAPMSEEQIGAAAVANADKKVAAARASMQSRGVQTTTNEVYEVTSHSKKGQVAYGMVEESTSGPLGQDANSMVYASYEPSKAARVNQKKGELSLAVGQSYSLNKDERGDRYATNGMAAGANLLWDASDHFGFGFDYMYLNPDAKSHTQKGEKIKYRDLRAYDISLAGKYTLNVWESWRVYIPMGAGMMNIRMKTDAKKSTSRDKWGPSVYAGLGLQYDISTDWFVGLEYRYIYSFISDKHLSNYGRNSNFQFHNAFLRIGMRF